MYLRQAAALLSLAYADPIQLSHAERMQRESLGNGRSEVVTNLVRGAKFHRAMMMKGPRTTGRKNLAAALFQNRKKRATDHPKIERSTEEAECDLLADGDPDVGILSYSGCSEDNTCIESESSSLGGICVALNQVNAVSGRLLQSANCTSGCPGEVCGCLYAYDDEGDDCISTIVGACNDGTFTTSCLPDYNITDTDIELYCSIYGCLDDLCFTRVPSEAEDDKLFEEASYFCYDKGLCGAYNCTNGNETSCEPLKDSGVVCPPDAPESNNCDSGTESNSTTPAPTPKPTRRTKKVTKKGKKQEGEKSKKTKKSKKEVEVEEEEEGARKKTKKSKEEEEEGERKKTKKSKEDFEIDEPYDRDEGRQRRRKSRKEG